MAAAGNLVRYRLGPEGPAAAMRARDGAVDGASMLAQWILEAGVARGGRGHGRFTIDEIAAIAKYKKLTLCKQEVSKVADHLQRPWEAKAFMDLLDRKGFLTTTPFPGGDFLRLFPHNDVQGPEDVFQVYYVLTSRIRQESPSSQHDISAPMAIDALISQHQCDAAAKIDSTYWLDCARDLDKLAPQLLEESAKLARISATEASAAAAKAAEISAQTSKTAAAIAVVAEKATERAAAAKAATAKDACT